MENHILMLPDMLINADEGQIIIRNSCVDRRKLLINALYWDKIVVPVQPYIGSLYSNDGVAGFKKLREAGIVETPVVDLASEDGDITKYLYNLNMHFLIESLKRKDINFVANDVENILISNATETIPDNGELFTLVNAIPEPDVSVHIDDVLEFRMKRQENLKYLMNQINQLNIRVLKSENRDLELKAALNEIDIACAEVIRLYRESRIKFNLSDFKFNFNIPEIVVNTGAAYTAAKSFGLPETGAVIASVAYGVSTFVNFSPSMSLKKIDKSNPFNYVGEMSVKLN